MPFETIDAYLAAQPPEARAKLALVRAAIRRAAPEAVEAISYQIPAFRLNGRVFIFSPAGKTTIRYTRWATRCWKPLARSWPDMKSAKARSASRWTSLCPRT